MWFLTAKFAVKQSEGMLAIYNKKNRYARSYKYSRLCTSRFIYRKEYLAVREISVLWPLSRNAFIEEDFKGASIYLKVVMYPLL
jgi:hypothetical protein